MNPRIRALTIRPPWSDLIATGIKTEIEDAHPLTAPVPCAGALSLWRPTDHLLQAVAAAASPGTLRLLRAK